MDASVVKSYIQTGNIPRFLIFTGPEWVVQNIYIDKIAEVLGLQKKRVESISDIYGTLNSRNIFAKNSLYVIRDDKEITGNEKIQTQLKEGLLKDNYLILLLTVVDKRTKFYKQYNSQIIEFNTLKPMVLKKYIQKEIDLCDSNIDKLMEICEYDYGRCLLEIDKIKNYSSVKSSPDDSFLHLLKDGTIYQTINEKDVLFDFVDAVMNRDSHCFYLYELCNYVGHKALPIMTLLYNNAKALLQVQSCPTGNISKTTGLTVWQIEKVKPYMNKYRSGELVNLMRLIRQCEKGIKTGQYEEQLVIDYILINTL